MLTVVPTEANTAVSIFLCGFRAQGFEGSVVYVGASGFGI